MNEQAAATASTDRQVATPLEGRRLVLCAALSPAAWLVHIAALPALVPLACDTGATWPMTVTTAACGLVAAIGVLQLHRARRAVVELEGSRSHGGPGSPGRNPSAVEDPLAASLPRGRMWSGAGLVVGWLFLVLIFVEHVPALMIDPCPP